MLSRFLGSKVMLVFTKKWGKGWRIATKNLDTVTRGECSNDALTRIDIGRAPGGTWTADAPVIIGRRGMMTDEEMTDRTDLSDLLRARKEEIKLSFRELTAACIDPDNPDGGPLYKRTTLENLVKGAPGVKAPSPAQLKGLTSAFRLPFGRVQEAAGAQFFGMDTVWSDDEELRALVHGYRDMNPEDQALVRAIIESRRGVPKG